MTIIRDRQTSRSEFIFHSERIIRNLIDEALNFLEYETKEVVTPTGDVFKGIAAKGSICGVSIMRAGESMENVLRQVCPAVRIGKILIQRDEGSNEKSAKLYYSKLPPDVAKRTCLLLDPMLASAGSALMAIENLLSAGVSESKIIFVNLVSCPEGINNLAERYPEVKVVTAAIDNGLNNEKYILPGLGDFGCRYFGTSE